MRHTLPGGRAPVVERPAHAHCLARARIGDGRGEGDALARVHPPARGRGRHLKPACRVEAHRQPHRGQALGGLGPGGRAQEGKARRIDGEHGPALGERVRVDQLLARERDVPTVGRDRRARAAVGVDAGGVEQPVDREPAHEQRRAVHGVGALAHVPARFERADQSE
jgi:hypothetical protein